MCRSSLPVFALLVALQFGAPVVEAANPFSKIFRRGEEAPKAEAVPAPAEEPAPRGSRDQGRRRGPSRTRLEENARGALAKWFANRKAEAAERKAAEAAAQPPVKAGPVAETPPEAKPETAATRPRERRTFGQWLADRKHPKEEGAPQAEEVAKIAPKPEPEVAEEPKQGRRTLGQWFASRRAADPEEPEKVGETQPEGAAPKPLLVDQPKQERRTFGQWLADRKRAKGDVEEETQPLAEEKVEPRAEAVAEVGEPRARPRLGVPQFLRRPDPARDVPEGSLYLVAQKTPLYVSNPGMPPFSMSYRGGVEQGEIVAADSNKGPFTKVRRLHDGREGFVNSLVLKRATSRQFLAWKKRIDDGYRPSNSYAGGETLMARNGGSSGRPRISGASDALFRAIPPPEGAEEPDLPSKEEAPLSSILFGGGN